jgi:hypothetical protein
MTTRDPAENLSGREKSAVWRRWMRKLKRYATWRYPGPALLARARRNNDTAGE